MALTTTKITTISGGQNMSNIIRNKLTVEGDAAAVKNFFEEISGVDGNGNSLVIDFNKINKTPTIFDIERDEHTDAAIELYLEYKLENAGLNHIKTELKGSCGDIYTKMYSAIKDKYTALKERDPDLWELGQQCVGYLSIFGASTLDEWRRKNWGTPRNAYNQRRIDENTIEFSTDQKQMTKLIRALSVKYPALRLTYTYAGDDYGNYVGELKFSDGNCIHRNQPETYSAEAYRIANAVLGQPETDVEEEDN
jgi:hypothetical protein